MPIALEDEVTLPDGRSGTVKGIHGDDWYSVTLAAGEEVKIQFENNQINSGHFDLFINENIAKIYDNVSFDNNLSKINADIINIDLASGNINVDMYNKSNKVKFLKK